MLHTDHTNKTKINFWSIIIPFSSMKTRNWYKDGLKLANRVNWINLSEFLLIQHSETWI